MRLRNKKTGEIGYLTAGRGIDHYVVANNERVSCGKYNSLADLNSEWEDVPEEPKEYWYIGDSGEVWVFNHNYLDTEIEEVHKEIGNYFETKEEAEKAVEKLKAWKRLKDKGFSFHGYDDGYDHDFNSGHIEFYVKNSGDVLDDLDLLFGGEE